MPLSTGQVLHHSRYRIGTLLGQGGMGAVYRAWDTSLNIPVAVKENLEAALEAQRQFSREAQILARPSHPNLPRVIDYFIIPDQGQYLVMDYVEGEDMQAMLGRLGALPESPVLDWIAQICDALAYLHGQPLPIIHRDIKPSNIRIRPDGRAMLVDFGIAKIFNPRTGTTAGTKAVTPGYSPPEQYSGGTTDPRSDIYSLGATLYHVLTGQTPPAATMRIASRSAFQPPRLLNPRISPAVEAIVLRAMELVMEDRFPSAQEMAAALRSARSASLEKPEVQVLPVIEPVIEDRLSTVREMEAKMGEEPDFSSVLGETVPLVLSSAAKGHLVVQEMAVPRKAPVPQLCPSANRSALCRKRHWPPCPGSVFPHRVGLQACWLCWYGLEDWRR